MQQQTRVNTHPQSSVTVHTTVQTAPDTYRTRNKWWAWQRMRDRFNEGIATHQQKSKAFLEFVSSCEREHKNYIKVDNYMWAESIS